MNTLVALVTGGTRGIGRAISLELARRGAIVYAGYASKSAGAQAWLAELRSQGINNIHLLQADVSSSACTQAIDGVIAQHGAIDILVNNAGITDHNPFDVMSFEQWSSVMRTNVDSLFHVTQPVLRAMKRKGFGRIVNMSSVNGHKGQKGEVNYSMSKAAMLGFTKALAQEVAASNITVNSVSPGYISTELTASLPRADIDKILIQVPVGRLGSAEEIASTVAYLADPGSGFITGSDISINGGLHMH